MRFNKKISLFLILSILLLSLIPQVLAFTYKVEPLSSSIEKDGIATFQLTIKNTLSEPDYFTISTRDVNWILSSEPASGDVAADSEGVFVVELRPKASLAEENVYIIPVKIKSEKTQSYYEEGKKFAVLLGIGSKNYLPTITPIVYVDKVVDPKEPVSVRVSLKNRNQRALENLQIILDGGEGIQKSYTTNLQPLEEKVNEVLFRVDPYTTPGKRILKLQIMFDNKSLSDSSAEFEIIGYSNMQEKITTSKSLFLQKQTIEIYNNGNEEGLAEHKFEIGFFTRLFTNFDPQAKKEKDSNNQVYYSVKKMIGAKEVFTIQTSTDYRLLATIIVLLIISVILYFIYRSPVIIYKSADPIGKPTAEGLSEIKVRLYLKNRSGKTVTNIRVTDVVPAIADIKKSAHIGSMDPVNISKIKKGTIARWEFANLEPYEERVIAYKIESKLKLVGGIHLPSAKTRFEQKAGKERITHSNSVNLIHIFEDK